jgi:hypothetical protein
VGSLYVDTTNYNLYLNTSGSSWSQIYGAISTSFSAPGSIAYTTAFYDTVNNAVTAAGTNQGTATALTAAYNTVTTATANQGVILPAVTTPGQTVYIDNSTAVSIIVYPPTGGSIDGAGTNVGITFPPGAEVAYKAMTTTAWNSPANYYVGTANQINTSGDGIITLSLAQPQVAITAATAAIGTTETVIAKLLIGNGVVAGDTYSIEGFGTCTSSASRTSTFNVRCGTAGTTADGSINTITATSTGSGTGVGFFFRILVTFRTTGTSGTALANGHILGVGTTGITAAPVVSTNATAGTVNTTSNNYLDITYVASGTNTTCTFQNVTISKVR